MEPPKVSHKKKTDREREKERMEKELAEKVKADYKNRQGELNRPILPREPLKRTDGNNWVHVLCAAWTPEIRFSHARALERSEGFSAIPMERYEAICKLCKSNRHGSCVSCQQCKANFHVGCAAQAGYTFGFDVTPVKGSRKDQITTVTLGSETGALTAAIWCKDHTVKTVVHAISEAADDTQKNALQLFVESYKQADQTLTGTARKANLLSQSTKLPAHSAVAPIAANRRVSMASVAARGHRNSSAGLSRADESEGASPLNETLGEETERRCVTCSIDVSPKWWTAGKEPSPEKSSPELDGEQDIQMGGMTNGTPHVNGDHVKEELKPNGDGYGHAAGSREQNRLPQYCCHKCHWKKLHETESKSEQGHPLNSPPKALPALPSWVPTIGENSTTLTSQSPQHAAAGSPDEVPRNVLSSGQGPTAQPHGAPYAIYGQTNGFAPPPVPALQSQHCNGVNGNAYSQSPHVPGPQSHYPVARDQASPRPPPSQYVPASGHGSGIQHHQHPMMAPSSTVHPSQGLSNGMRSPRQYQLGSPSHLGAGGPPYPQQHGTFGAAQQAQAQSQPQLVNGQHGSPPLSLARPVTPRDSSVDTRVGANAGASASPSLRNLLH